MARRGGSGEPRGRARDGHRRESAETEDRREDARAGRRGARGETRHPRRATREDRRRRRGRREANVRARGRHASRAVALCRRRRLGDFKNEADGRGRVMGGGSRRPLSEGCMFVSARGTLMIDFMVHYSRFGPDEKKNCTDRFSGHLPDAIRSMVRTASGRLDCIRVRSGEPGMFWVFFSVPA